MLPSNELKKVEVMDYVRVVTKRLWLIAIVMLISAGVFLVLLFKPVPKKYVSTAMFLIGKHPAASAMESGTVFGRGGSPYAGDQSNLVMGTMESYEFAERVSADLKISPRRILNMIEIRSVNPETKTGGRVIQLTAESRDPVLAAKVANAWMEELIRSDVEAKKGYSEFGATWLEDSRDEIAEKLRAAENQLMMFERQNRGVKDRANAMIALRKKRNELSGELSDLSLKYKKKHPVILSTKRRLNIVNEQIEELNKQMEGGEKKIFQYQVLRQQVQLYRNMYNNFLDASEKADIAKGLILPSIQVISTAQVPTSPVYVPKRVPYDILLGGLAVAVALCFLLEYLDTTLKTPEEVEFFGKMPFLGDIPYVRRREVDNLFLLTASDPASPVAENFRNIKVSLLFAFPEDKHMRTLLVCSTQHAEGKTFVAANLATAFAMSGERTVLVDSDIRKGRLAKSFSSDVSGGLVDYLKGEKGLGEIICDTEVKNLSLLGTGPNIPNAIDILSVEKTEALIGELSERFDRIIIDGVPLQDYADDLYFANSSDAILNVVAKGEVSFHDIQAARKKIEEIDAHLGKHATTDLHTIAAVLNSTTPFVSEQRIFKKLIFRK